MAYRAFLPEDPSEELRELITDGNKERGSYRRYPLVRYFLAIGGLSGGYHGFASIPLEEKYQSLVPILRDMAQSVKEELASNRTAHLLSALAKRACFAKPSEDPIELCEEFGFAVAEILHQATSVFGTETASMRRNLWLLRGAQGADVPKDGPLLILAGPQSDICSNLLCEKPARDFFCERCNGLDNEPRTIAYCSERCRNHHPLNHFHDPDCKRMHARRALQRFASILREILRQFFWFYLNTSDVLSTWEEKGNLYVSVKNMPLQPGRAPPGLIQRKQDAVMMCRDPTMLMMVHGMIRPLLVETGICSRVDIVSTLVRNITRPIAFVQNPTDERSDIPRVFRNINSVHIVLRVTIKSTEEVFCIDLTGEQYGWHEPLMEWSRYSQHRISHVKDAQVTSIQDFGSVEGPSQLVENKNAAMRLSLAITDTFRDWRRTVNASQPLHALMKGEPEVHRFYRNSLMNHFFQTIDLYYSRRLDQETGVIR